MHLNRPLISPCRSVKFFFDNFEKIILISLILHPGIAYLMTAEVFALNEGFVRSATVMAAMAPGVNFYVFCSMYQRAMGEAATIVVISTALSILSASLWLWILGGAAV